MSTPVSAEPAPRRGRLKLMVVLISTAIALLGAEIALRINNPMGFRMRGNTLVLPINKTYHIHADDSSRTNQLEADVTHTKNSLGFRGPEPPKDFANYLTVVAVGGSTTECFYLNDGKSWPERLGARLEPGFRNLWVENAGLDGQTTFGHLVLTNQALVPLHPKVTVYLMGVNDMFTDAPREFDNFQQTPMAFLAGHSEVAATLLNLYRWNRTRGMEDLGTMPKPVALRDRPNNPVPPEQAQRMWNAQNRRLADFRARLERLVALNRDNGIEPVLVTQPSLLGDVDPRTGIDTRPMEVELWEKLDGALTWKLLDERYNETTRQIGKEKNVKVVDLGRAMPKDSTYFYDFFHFTNEGADKVAEIIDKDLAPWLAEHYPAYKK